MLVNAVTIPDAAPLCLSRVYHLQVAFLRLLKLQRRLYLWNLPRQGLVGNPVATES